MPVLRNARHEAFAQALAKGKSATEAYAAAGYAESRSAASRLSTNVNIKRRVAEIVGKVSDKAEWTAADRLLSLKRIHDAQLDKDARVSIAAIAEANKMQGSHAPAKLQHAGANGGPIQTVDLTNLSTDDLDRLEALFGPLAGTAGDDAEDDQAGEGA
jgi:phage terminase small subunit